ncbi:MAG: polysaccharide export protein [Alphaproteobacteria bacterium]|nr:polysaccharide export protein [Alphaproteobacteria bacterium]
MDEAAMEEEEEFAEDDIAMEEDAAVEEDMVAEDDMAMEEDDAEAAADMVMEEDEEDAAAEDDVAMEEEEEEDYEDSLFGGEDEEEEADPEAALARQYRLGPGDRLSVIVFGQNDLSGEFEISGNGEISLPLAGPINAAGLTTSEFQARVTKILDESYLVDPRVNIDVVNYRPFYVLGEVARPGRYDYVSGLDVRQAIALAGGFTRRGYQSAVKLIRDEGGDRVEYKAGLDAPLSPGDTLEAVRRLF